MSIVGCRPFNFLCWRGHKHLLDAAECAFEHDRQFCDTMPQVFGQDETRGDARPDLHASQESALHVNGSPHIHIEHGIGAESPASSSSCACVRRLHGVRPPGTTQEHGIGLEGGKYRNLYDEYATILSSYEDQACSPRAVASDILNRAALGISLLRVLNCGRSLLQ